MLGFSSWNYVIQSFWNFWLAAQGFTSIAQSALSLGSAALLLAAGGRAGLGASVFIGALKMGREPASLASLNDAGESFANFTNLAAIGKSYASAAFLKPLIEFKVWALLTMVSPVSGKSPCRR